jgi:hypothetical protein
MCICWYWEIVVTHVYVTHIWHYPVPRLCRSSGCSNWMYFRHQANRHVMIHASQGRLQYVSVFSRTVCFLHRQAEGIWPRKLGQTNADPKENWYRLVWKKTDQQIVHGPGVKVRLDRGESNVQIGRAVRKGCCLSPILSTCTANASPRKLWMGLETSTTLWSLPQPPTLDEVSLYRCASNPVRCLQDIQRWNGLNIWTRKWFNK